MISDFVALTESIKAISTLVSSAKDLGDYNKTASALTEANAKLLEAQRIAFSIQKEYASASARISDLESQISDLKSVKTEKERYSLHALPSGMLVHAVKEIMKTSEPEHYLCSACFSNDQITILQPVQQGRLTRYICHNDHPNVM